MRVIKKIRKLRNQLRKLHLSPVGLVPTMGALHMGHISLVENAVSECPVVVVTIYVNPAQFNDSDDLENYPRTVDDDLDLLCRALRKNDIVFIPDDSEIYPGEDNRVFSFGNLDNVMEALHRPGHFNGVARVVSRLFEIVDPDVAYFGLKDFQQVAVVKSLVSQTGSRVRIKAGPTVREYDGLAMSSRNRLLGPAIRRNAGVIFATLSEAARMVTDHPVEEIRDHVIKRIGDLPGFSVEYFEIVDDTELVPVAGTPELQSGRRYFGCIAVKAGNVRLIDNIEIPL
ncbi:MAG: pantoate--beta-alanine ligase [Bacteroidales bacterium]|nr:pantoate--beta-alanine ligase [Bacteroidales bacterium]